MKIFRIHFEDHGQDFLTWDVDVRTCRVVDAAPFQKEIWQRCTVLNLYELAEGEDKTVLFESEINLPGFIDEIKYPVEQVEALEIEEGE